MLKIMIFVLWKMIGKALLLVQQVLVGKVWCDGMEITQFTYFQQMTGIECKPVPVEITYGLERLCMFVQGKKMFLNLIGIMTE